MVLSLGVVKFSDIQTEMGGANPVSMSEYYNANGKFSLGTGGIPASGAINVGSFRGKARMISLASQVYSPKIWLRMDELANLSNNSTVSTWTGANGLNATAYAVGTASLPVYKKTSETFPFVRLGTNTRSTADGNYLNFGSQTFNMGTNGGFTAVFMVRFYNLANWERIIDFGSGAGVDNLIIGRMGNLSSFCVSYYNGSSFSQDPSGQGSITGGWQVIAVRITTTELKFYENTTATYTGLTVQNKTLSNTYIGRSNWPDEYANIDLREMLIYDKALSDTEVAYVRNMLLCKYANTISLNSGLYMKYYNQGCFNDNPNWFVSYSPTNASSGMTDFSNLNTATSFLQSVDSGDNFSIEWLGWFYASATGTYTFFTESDDMSYLWIGPTATIGYTTTNALVNNGGTHGMTEVSGSIILSAGTYYPIRIQYGDSTSANNMKVAVTPPSGTKTYNLSGYMFNASAVDAPVSSGLVGYYKGSSLSGNTWNDLSGTGNNATCTGTISTSTVNGETFIYGGTSATITWPAAILPSVYTLFYVAKYNGTTRDRIFCGKNTNWLSGFFSGKSGVAYHNAWLTDSVNDKFGNNWIVGTDQGALFKANTINLTLTAPGTPRYDQLSVNLTANNSMSDWAIANVIVYNRELSASEISTVENWMVSKYGLGTNISYPSVGTVGSLSSGNMPVISYVEGVSFNLVVKPKAITQIAFTGLPNQSLAYLYIDVYSTSGTMTRIVNSNGATNMQNYNNTAYNASVTIAYINFTVYLTSPANWTPGKDIGMDTKFKNIAIYTN